MSHELSSGEIWGIAQTLSGDLGVNPNYLTINAADLPPFAVDDIFYRTGMNVGQLIGALSNHFGLPEIDNDSGNMKFRRR